MKRKRTIWFLIILSALFFTYEWASLKSDDYLRARVVKLGGNHMMCSGEQVRAPSGVDYILSAAHCRPIQDADGNFSVTTEDGRTMKRRLIAEDPVSDLILIEGMPNLRGLDVGDSVDFKQHVRTFTHGNNLATYKTEGVIVDNKEIGVPAFVIENEAMEASCSLPKLKIVDLTLFGGPKICIMDVTETITTAFIAHGSSGGLAVDDSGDLIGVVSTGGDGFGGLVKLSDIKSFLKNY